MWQRKHIRHVMVLLVFCSIICELVPQRVMEYGLALTLAMHRHSSLIGAEPTGATGKLPPYSWQYRGKHILLPRYFWGLHYGILFYLVLRYMHGICTMHVRCGPLLSFLHPVPVQSGSVVVTTTEWASSLQS